MRFRHSPAFLIALAACAPKSGGAPQEVTFTATEFTFNGPDSIAPGLTTVHFANQGAQDHHLILGRLEDGKTVDEVMAFMKEHPTAEPPYLAWHGAGNAIAAGGTNTSTVDLSSGKYLAICFMPDPATGQPHVVEGMLKQFVVAGAPHSAGAPKADGEIRLKDFSFDAPPMTAGAHIFHVINDGLQTHEVQLVRLNDGVTVQDYLAAMAPGAKAPPPGVLMGGPGAFSKGLDGYWTVDFAPGTYAFLCFVPDTASGMPHMMKGMVREFTISAT